MVEFEAPAERARGLEYLPFRHDHVALSVRDLGVSREFYEYLGGRVVSRPSTAFLEIVLGELRLHLLPSKEAPRSSSPPIDHLCLRVSSVDQLVAVRDKINAHPLFGERSCEVEESTPLGDAHVEECPPRKTLYFEDPDGIRLEIRAYA